MRRNTRSLNPEALAENPQRREVAHKKKKRLKNLGNFSRKGGKAKGKKTRKEKGKVVRRGTIWPWLDERKWGTSGREKVDRITGGVESDKNLF